MHAVAKNRLNRRTRPLVILLCLVNVACVGPGGFAPDWRQNPAYETSQAAEQCMDAFMRFDQAVRQAGTGDAETSRLNGFPYFRINRFLASFRDQDLSPRQFDAWLDSMMSLGAEARFVEAQNMRRSPVPLDRLDLCAETILKADKANDEFELSLRRAAHVPDHYSFWKRLAGGYPVTNLAAAIGYASWKRETLDAFSSFSSADEKLGPLYQPALHDQVESDAAGVLAVTRRNLLGIPDLSGSQRKGLLAAFAPVVRVGSDKVEDRIGHPEWSQDAASPGIAIDGMRPAIFGRVAYAYWKGEPTIQLVYTMWFSERPKTNAVDLLGGSLDGLIWRVTLDQQGQPIVYDSIHPCGCYHLFFPAQAITRKIVPEDSDLRESILVPLTAPDLMPRQRIQLTLESGTHYIVSVDATSLVEGESNAVGYEIMIGDQVPDEGLRLMPLSNALATRSLYDEDGLIRQSERLERWILWPMGIESAGAMRQWGTHATAFVGRRHFDDPYLIDNSFE